MVQDLTLEEIAWRYDVLNRHLDRILEDAADEYCESNNTELESTYLREQICASIIYLHKIGATKLVVCKPNSLIADSSFHATKKECIENADNIDDEDIWGPEEHKNISIPIIFNENDSDDSLVCLEFDFPEDSLSKLCREMMELLRLWCTTDIDVINMIIFMDYYFTKEQNAYNKCVWNVFLGLFDVDFWENRKQLPWEIMEVVESLLRMNDKEIGNLYDPFSRTGMNSILPHDKYYAHIDDVRHYNAVRLFNGICGQDYDNIQFNSCIDNWNPKDCKTIIATPKLDQKVLIAEGKSISIGEWLLDKMQSSLTTPNRQAMLILPANVLYNKGNIEHLRCKLSEANLIDAIILLPHDMIYGTGAATCLLLLSTEREADEDILLIDLTSAPMKHEDEEDEDSRLIIDCEEFYRINSEEDPRYYKMVKISDIVKNNYNWYIPSYFVEETDVPAGYVNIKINGVLQDSDNCHYFAMGDYAVFTENKMKSNPFEDNRIYVDTTPKKVDFDVFNNSVEQYKKTHEENNGKPLDLLVNALNTNPPDFLYYYSDIFTIDINNGVLRTAWFEKTDNLYSIKIDKKWNSYHVNKDEFNIDYLRLVLYKETQKFIDNLAEGENIDLSDILNMEIMIPMSVDEQKELYEEEKMNYLIEKARKEGLDEAIKRMKDEYMSEVRMRKHDMKPFISQLDSHAKMLNFHLDKIEGNDDVVAAMKTKVDSMLDIVNELRTHLNRLTEEDIYGEPERMNLKDALMALEGNMESYQIAVRIDELALQDAKITVPEVMMSPVDFSTLANTIIENAITHAFIDEIIKYYVLITMTVNKESDKFIIDFKNDGAPMPDGMNKYRYGLKGEKGANSQGYGYGGYRIKSIVNHYGGDYDVLMHNNFENMHNYFENRDSSIEQIIEVSEHTRAGHWRRQIDGQMTWIPPVVVKSHKRHYSPFFVTTIRIELPIYRHNEKV